MSRPVGRRSAAARPPLARSARAWLLLVLAAIVLALAVSVPASAQVPDADPGVETPDLTPPSAPTSPTAPTEPQAPASPEVSVTIDGLDGDEGMSRTVTMVLLLTVSAVTPILLLLMTTFTRFVVVLGLARQGLGLQAVPPAQVLVGLALFLSLFSMGPTLAQVNEQALQPMLAGDMTTLEAAEAGFGPMREFMLSQTREDDLALFTDLSGADAPATPADVGVTTLVPAFVVSELRTAFTIGFVVFVPFLVVDLVVASVLMALGMVMLPPIFVSLPVKLLLFVLVDGWALLSRTLVTSVVG